MKKLITLDVLNEKVDIEDRAKQVGWFEQDKHIFWDKECMPAIRKAVAETVDCDEKDAITALFLGAVDPDILAKEYPEKMKMLGEVFARSINKLFKAMSTNAAFKKIHDQIFETKEETTKE